MPNGRLTFPGSKAFDPGTSLSAGMADQVAILAKRLCHERFFGFLTGT